MTSMDFFGHQERARRSSRRLVLLFALAVAGIVLCVYAAASALLMGVDDGQGGFFRLDVLAVVAAGTLVVVGSAALFKTAQLRSGGGAVATLLGGKPVPMATTDPKERMLRNLVEEMAIASGVPVPEVYVLDGESGINAFAAGWSPADAAIAVTRGCLERLDRDELQGVVAHEFSHVFHGDMRLNIRLMGVLFGIVCITTIGRIVVNSVGRGAVRSSRGGKGGGGAAGVVVFGVALIVIGALGVLFARLIQAAVSRQREFLADASAVQYTRNPHGIGRALAKIGGLSTLASPHAEEASHMLFADGMRRHLGGALATHPPVEERVERILPGFRRQLASSRNMVEAAAAVPAPALAAGAAGFAGAAPAVRPGALVAAAGDPQARDVAAARALLQQLPLEVAMAARDQARADALVAALLLDRDPARRERQLAGWRQDHPQLAHEAAALHLLVARLDAGLRLPLLELAMPALRAQPAAERQRLRTLARQLALADGRLSPFEFALLRLLEHHVRLPGEEPPRPPGRPAPLVRHAADVAVVLSVLARAGAGDDEAAAAAAFGRGHAHLGAMAPMQLLPAAACDGADLERAVDALARVSPLGKRNLLAACAEAAAADGTLTTSETDLLRALAATWDCPLPLTAGSPPAA
ncbi:MAG: M48 family metallopeptidase [Planctomycetes bacterium]|nr:M48 family metallopeptidase [Planctomycetota bacterium]